MLGASPLAIVRDGTLEPLRFDGAFARCSERTVEAPWICIVLLVLGRCRVSFAVSVEHVQLVLDPLRFAPVFVSFDLGVGEAFREFTITAVIRGRITDIDTAGMGQMERGFECDFIACFIPLALGLGRTGESLLMLLLQFGTPVVIAVRGRAAHCATKLNRRRGAAGKGVLGAERGGVDGARGGNALVAFGGNRIARNPIVVASLSRAMESLIGAADRRVVGLTRS